MFKANRSWFKPGKSNSYESGIFHFADSMYVESDADAANGFIFDYPALRKTMADKENGERLRDVMLVRLLAKSVEMPASWQDYPCVDVHASLDRYVIADGKSPFSYYFTHWHITFEYRPLNIEQAGLEKIIMHAYGNRHGVMVNYNADQYFIDNNKKPIAIDPQLKAFIQTQANLFSAHFIELLLQKKNEAYFELQQRYETVSDELARDEQNFRALSFTDESLKSRCIAKIDELLAIVEKINLHDELRSDNRSVYLRDYRAYLEEAVVEASTLEEKENKSFADSVERNKNINKNKRNKAVVRDASSSTENEEFDFSFSVNHQALFELKNKEVQTVVDKLRYFSTQENFSYDSRQVLIFVRKHYSVLINFFKEQVLSGNVEQVMFLYSFISSVKQKIMHEIFVLFFDFLENCSDEILAKQLTSVGDFFYENSETYRASVFQKNCQRYAQVFKHDIFKFRSESLLWRLYLMNRLEAFSMFLRQGIRPISQYTQCHYNEVSLSLPSAIIFSFRKNPNLGFLVALRQFEALEEDQQSSGQFYFSSPREREDTKEGFFLHLEKCSKTVSPFSLAMRRAVIQTNYPLSIIKDFAEQVSFYAVIFELADLFNYDNFMFIVVPVATRRKISSEINIFKTTDDMLRVMIDYTSLSEDINSVHVLFHQENDMRREALKYLLDRVTKDFSSFSAEKQRDIIQFVMHKIIENKNIKDNSAKVMLILANFLDSLLQHPDNNDYLVRLKLFCLRIEIDKGLLSEVEMNQICCHLAQVLCRFAEKFWGNKEFIDLVGSIYLDLLSVSQDLKKLKVIFSLAMKYEQEGDFTNCMTYYSKAFQLGEPLIKDREIVAIGAMLVKAKIDKFTEMLAKHEPENVLTSNSSAMYTTLAGQSLLEACQEEMPGDNEPQRSVQIYTLVGSELAGISLN